MLTKAQIAYRLYQVRTGLWFVPTVMALAAICLAELLPAIDRLIPRGWFTGARGLLAVEPQGARLILATIAGSMMTVTSLVFSMTLVALTLASSQFGPRLLTSFMRNRTNQFVLGMFLGTFLYALLILRTIYQTADGSFVPHLSLMVALALAVISFGLLIFFIHHVASSMQADTVIANVARDLDGSISSVFREIEKDDRASYAVAPAVDVVETPPRLAPVHSRNTGYVQAIDYSSLLDLATRRDALIRLELRAGHFIIAGQPMAYVSPPEVADEPFCDAVNNMLAIGPTRTMTQDVEFALGSLVELALRALSPGINDPHTALVCIDYIGAALARATLRGLPPAYLSSEDGKPRILTSSITYEGLLAAGFNEIRQVGSHNVAICIRLVEALIRIAPFAWLDAHREALRRQAEMIARAYQAHIAEPNDRDDIERRLQKLEAMLGEQAA